MYIGRRHQLPAVPSDVERLRLHIVYNRSGNSDGGGLDDGDLDALARFPRLIDVELEKACVFGDAAMARFVEAHPRVQRLTLAGASQLGTPGLAALARLPLTRLTLKDCAQAGWLEQLSGLSLRALRLVRCEGLSPEALRRLAVFRDLDELVLDGQLVDQDVLEAVASLPGLRCLRLYNRTVWRGALRGLAEARSLEELVVRRPLAPEEAAVLAQLPKLRRLTCTVSSGEGARPLSPLSGAVEDITLAFEDYPRVPERLLIELSHTLPGLRGLDIGHLDAYARKVSFPPEALRHVGELTSLRRLALRWLGRFGNADLAPLARLEQLEVLQISRVAGLTMGFFQTLAELRSLRDLDLSDPAPTDASLKRLQALTALETLSLWSGKKLSDKGLAHLTRVPTLKRLRVNDWPSQIGDAGVQVLAALPALEVLHLSTAALSEAAWLALGRAPSLRELGLIRGAARLSDSSLRALGASQTLERLELGPGFDLSVSDAGLDALLAAPALRLVDLRGAGFSQAALARAQQGGVYVSGEGSVTPALAHEGASGLRYHELR
ncbi:MAG: hypothetical protein H6740_19230 [Alphaproteobacteria bacterium]|nr:hypothetical protein [Alphaproteobacteria bacterium]